MHIRSLLAVTLIALVAFAAPVLAETPISFGGQLNFADDFDFGIGARAMMDTEDILEQTRAVASFDYYFAPDPFTFWELNVNGHYLFAIENAPAQFYAGAGLHIGHVSFDAQSVFGVDVPGASNTEAGLNLLGGVEFDIEASVTPFAELKIELGGAEQFVITGGVTF